MFMYWKKSSGESVRSCAFGGNITSYLCHAQIIFVCGVLNYVKQS